MVMKEQENEEVIPKEINKVTVLIVIALMFISGTIGFAFGVDKGYETGLADAGQRPMQQQPITMP